MKNLGMKAPTTRRPLRIEEKAAKYKTQYTIPAAWRDEEAEWTISPNLKFKSQLQNEERPEYFAVSTDGT